MQFKDIIEKRHQIVRDSSKIGKRRKDKIRIIKRQEEFDFVG
jgi:hypothetical protein